jgi:hypothetical protein
MLNGLERTKLLRKMQVRLGDVQPVNEFGELALGRESRSVAKFERESAAVQYFRLARRFGEVEFGCTASRRNIGRMGIELYNFD